MKGKISGGQPNTLRRAAIAMAVCAALSATAVHASASENIIVVPPADLPELARHGGDAMLLHETPNGRTLLYIEQSRGARLAAFDVTDPVHVKDEGFVELSAAQPFDFVSPVGKQTELVRTRRDHGYAVLDLHQERAPTLSTIEGLTLQGTVTPLGSDGIMVASQAAELPPARDIQVAGIGTPDRSRVFDVKKVHEELTNAETGTTFVLTDNGLFLIRRPAMESDKRRRDQEWFFAHNGN